MGAIEMTNTAFITGISGQDGSLLAEFLLDKGYQVYGLMRETSTQENLKDLILNKNLHLIYGDSLNNELIGFLFKTYKFSEIYNLASQSNIRLSYTNPLNTFNVTLIGTLILLDNIKKYSPKSKFFQASSSAMFGYSTDKDGFQRENTPFKPISPYASSKLFAHNISVNYRENEKLFVSTGILYNHESIKKKKLLGIVNTLAQKATQIKQGKLKSYHIPNLNVKIDMGHALDYVEAMWLTLQPSYSNDYIISQGKTHSIKYMCDYIFSKIGLDYKQYITTNTSPQVSFESKGDCCKLNQIGWNPKYDLNKTLDTILHYYENS